ncbi:DMT family transporter [Leeuwenhoekiella palythoae]|uniref:EamA domain-containing membrane protein RarD n=1 Tax=Leeuwenhoekiella palythoae TaxID=573501 RepID=A0A1M5ZHD7_9FLAO|nr:DMT family transporter [Leeuwenhoekiella palythoae]RXG27706.1 EamA-like transporter family protein [Leeuwenhoekiella palythoae]SHI23705.1 EamA domain-containing membrane protein RarD [Leeuwenhoekiella palythoae]
MQNDSLKSYLHFHVIVFIWGFTAVLGALISIGATALVWYRMLIASLVIFVYIKIKGISLKAKGKTVLELAGVGVLIALHWLTFFGAVKIANVSITLAMMSTGAFFTSILEPIFYKRKLIWYELVFGLLVIGGLYLIFEVETRYTEAIIVALISALLAALFTLFNGKYAKKHDSVMISFYELLTGALFITVFLAVTNRFDASFFQVQQTDWIYLIILATVCTAYAFIASVKVMKHLTPYTIMLTTNMEPVYGIILAFLILGDAEQMNTGFYFGAILILLTVILNGILKNARRRKAARALNTIKTN